jgi:hypothetical protein
MAPTHLDSEPSKATKWPVVALLLILLIDTGYASALEDLVARESANRDNESVEVYGGSVGKLEAVFILEWDDDNGIVSGYYYYPSRGRARTYRLEGTNPKPGVLMLREFTTTHSGGEELSANCRLVKRVTEDRIVWEGQMHNTDGRSLKMNFWRGRGDSEQMNARPASGNPIIAEGEEVTLEGFFVMAQGLDEREQLVPYEAIKLRKPISIRMEDGMRDNITHLKLQLEATSPDSFTKNAGNLLRVTGKVFYAWHGRSSFINPAKFQVSRINMTARPAATND